jgi:hypothetical protein
LIISWRVCITFVLNSITRGASLLQPIACDETSHRVLACTNDMLPI